MSVIKEELYRKNEPKGRNTKDRAKTELKRRTDIRLEDET